MNDAAYDISYLLELESTAPTQSQFCSAAPVLVKSEPSAAVMAQETLASELLQVAGHHEELIRQYMSLKDDSIAGTGW